MMHFIEGFAGISDFNSAVFSEMFKQLFDESFIVRYYF